MQVDPYIPVGIQLHKTKVGPCADRQVELLVPGVLHLEEDLAGLAHQTCATRDKPSIIIQDYLYHTRLKHTLNPNFQSYVLSGIVKPNYS